jgi:hypothetical protein
MSAHHLLPLCLLLLLGPACSRGPSFAHEVTPGVSLDSFHTVALDTRRDLVWVVEGQRTLEAPAYREAVLRELEAKGLRAMDPDQADLWLEVIAMVPAREGAPGGMREGGGGGRRGGGMAAGGGRGGLGGGRGAGALPGQAPRTPPVSTGGELTVVVKLLSRTDQRMVWFGSATFPAPERGDAPSPLDTPAGRMRRLMEPYPGLRAGR